MQINYKNSLMMRSTMKKSTRIVTVVAGVVFVASLLFLFFFNTYSMNVDYLPDYLEYLDRIIEVNGHRVKVFHDTSTDEIWVANRYVSGKLLDENGNVMYIEDYQEFFNDIENDASG